nr:MAG TPA: hypothetical protein [Caudoviricetes sp.]
MTANRRRHDFTLLSKMQKAARNRISGFRRPFKNPYAQNIKIPTLTALESRQIDF